MRRHASRKTSAHGHDSASATHAFRTVTFTCAPIFRSLNRIVAHWARAMSVPSRALRLSRFTIT